MPKKEMKEEGLEIHIPRKERKLRTRQEHKLSAPHVHTNVPRDKLFLTIDGRHIYNLVHLVGVLEQMDDHTFRYHANAEKNDFSNWIKDVMGNAQLAERLKNKDRKDTQIEILRYIVKELI